MNHLTLAEVDEIRGQWQRAVLLYLTDRCPVECSHCSVSALRDAPRADEALVGRLVDELCEVPAIRMVGISGGEPLAERRLVQSVAGKLADAGKMIVLYTSGFWGRDDGSVPQWVRDVLSRVSCVVLSTDSYHAERVPERRYLAALRASRAAGCWTAVQVLGSAPELAEARRLLTEAFGASWEAHAEIRATSLIARGRAAGLGPGRAWQPGHSFGPCPLAGAPVVRHDGRLTACCNEDVVSGRGPRHLHRSAVGDDTPRQSLAVLRRDPFLRAVNASGPGVISLLPRYRELGERSHPDICSLCWALLDHGAAGDPAVLALGLATAGAAGEVASQ